MKRKLNINQFINGRTLLMFSCDNDSLCQETIAHFCKGIKIFLGYQGIRVNEQSMYKGDKHMTALMLAVKNGFCEAVELLLAHSDIDLLIKNGAGKTVFDIIKDKQNEADAKLTSAHNCFKNDVD